MTRLHSSAPWLQPGARAERRGPSRCNGFPAGPGGTGYQPPATAGLGNLPNGMGSALECSERLLIFQCHRRSVRQVAGRHRLVACATRAGRQTVETVRQNFAAIFHRAKATVLRRAA